MNHIMEQAVSVAMVQKKQVAVGGSCNTLE